MIPRPTLVRLLLLALGFAATALGDDSPVSLALEPAVVTLAPDGTATLRVKVTTTDSYHIYSTVAQTGSEGAAPEPTSISVAPAGLVAIAGALKTSPALTRFDPNFQMELSTLEGSAWIDVPLKAAATLPAGTSEVSLVVNYQSCNDETCLPPAEVKLPFKVISGAAAAAPAAGGGPDPAELAAAKLVSAQVLPFTDHEIPADWHAKLVPPIAQLAATYPNGRAAFVYFSRLVDAVEAQDPAALPALVEEMGASPNAAVRALAVKRREVAAAMKEPLALKFTALDGTPVDSSQWKGKVIIVDFWATWCVPCVQSIPHLKELYERYHAKGLEIVNVSMDKPSAKAALVKLVAKLQMPWPQYFDGGAFQTPLAVRYGVQPIPHILLAGPDGMIVAVNPTHEALETQIKQLLKL